MNHIDTLQARLEAGITASKDNHVALGFLLSDAKALLAELNALRKAAALHA